MKNNKQFLTLEYDPEHALEWRIVLGERIPPNSAKFLHPMNGMTQEAFNTIPDDFGWLPYLISFLRAETRIPADLLHIFGDYDKDEFATAMKKAILHEIERTEWVVVNGGLYIYAELPGDYTARIYRDDTRMIDIFNSGKFIGSIRPTSNHECEMIANIYSDAVRNK